MAPEAVREVILKSSTFPRIHQRVLSLNERNKENSVCSYICTAPGLSLEGSLEFEWDPAKAQSNERKHKVTFAYAVRASLTRIELKCLIRMKSKWKSVGR